MVKTPQVKPDWNTGIYIGDGVVAAPRPMHEWTHDEIRDYYDSNPNLGLLTYAGMLGLSVGEVKDILLTEWRAQVAESDTEWFEGDY